MTGENPISDGCYRCGSDDLEGLEIEHGTGVTSPDGGEERRVALIAKCRTCGAEEER